jgi:uncharacterized protein DUF1961
MERSLFSALSILLISAALLSSCGKADLWIKGELLAGEDFSVNLEDWYREGDVRAEIVDGRLRFEATAATDVEKGNIWWKRHFQGPILIEYDYQSATEHGLTMVWWHAHGRDGEDLLSFQRSGRYEEYVKGRMNGYHCSYHRFGSGACNLRKSYGFHMLATAEDPIPAADLDNHHIRIYNQGQRIRFEVDGRLVHDFSDLSEPCIAGEVWNHTAPCRGTGPALSEGKIGIRHTQRQVAFYDNFKVYRLVEP